MMDCRLERQGWIGVWKLLVSGVLLGLSAAPIAAQTCVGGPAGASQSALAARTTFWGPGTTIGGSLDRNFAGPIALGAFLDVADGRARPVGARLIYEFPVESAFCAVLGAEYRSWEEQRDGEDRGENYRVAFPVGLAAGLSFGSYERLSFMHHIETGLTYNVEGERRFWRHYIDVGGTLMRGRFFGGVTITFERSTRTSVIAGIRL
jgi:hypothetical protein